MCPDNQILSAYFDGEVPEPWNKKIEEHLTGCSACRGTVTRFRTISGDLTESNDFLEALIPESMVKVYGRVMEEVQTRHPKFWERQVKIPVPFLAAAAAMVIFFGIGYFAGQSNLPGPAPVTVAQESSPDVLTVQLDDSDMTDLAAFLKNRDEKVQVFIELPSASFSHGVDEPQLIRAADYRP